jgi:hypothetical protein
MNSATDDTIRLSKKKLFIKASEDFCRISPELKRLSEIRDGLMIDAFSALEGHYMLLAQMLVQCSGSRLKAARWMCSRHKVFGGRTGYDVISDGEVDAIWDQIANSNK